MIIKKCICDMCGKEISEYDYNYSRSSSYHLDGDCGYGSTYDGQRIHIEFCGECFDKVMGGLMPYLKHSPEINDQ